MILNKFFYFVKKFPENISLITEKKTLSYKELFYLFCDYSVFFKKKIKKKKNYNSFG